MGNFNRDNRSGGGRAFRGSFRRRGSEDRPQMHKAVCSKCGNECEVPFKPTGDRPVFCSQCFERNGRFESTNPRESNFGKSDFSDRQMFDAVCDNCGNNCKLPFQPREGKPVYCSKCFAEKNNSETRNPKPYQNRVPQQQTDQYKKAFEELNNKLDKILKMLTPITPEKSVPKEELIKVKEDKKSNKESNITSTKKLLAVKK